MRHINSLLLLIVIFCYPNSLFASINDNLYAHFKFDGDLNDYVGGHMGVPSGGVNYESTEEDQAILLDGVDDFVTVANFVLPTNFTIVTKFKVNLPSTTLDDILAVSNGSGHGILLELEPDRVIDGEQGRFVRFLYRPIIGGAGGFDIYYPFEYNDSRWHTVAISKSFSTITMYVDGKEVDAMEVSGTVSSDVNILSIGSLTPSLMYRNFDGIIDEVRIYNKGLTADEMDYVALTSDIPGQVSVLEPSPSPTDCLDAENLVIITHGWNAGDAEWIYELKNLIDIHQKPSGSWCTWVHDWTVVSDLFQPVDDTSLLDAAQKIAPFLPPGADVAAIVEDIADILNPPAEAWSKAKAVGQFVAKELIKKQNLKYVHFIAHSAGSNVIQSAIDYISNTVDNELLTEYASGETIYANSDFLINATFLDAYRPPFSSKNTYGRNADWAEQYVDRRPLTLLDLAASNTIPWISPLFEDATERLINLGELETTDTDFTNLTNFSVENLDSFTINPVERHGWPYEFYINSVESLDDCAGFNLSYESGENGSTLEDWKIAINNKYSCSSGCSDYDISSLNPCKITKRPRVSQVVDSAINYVKTEALSDLKQIASETGNIAKKVIASTVLPGSSTFINVYEFVTGSPVWAVFEIETTQDISAIKFGYQFTSNANGQLIAYFDEEPIFYTEEVYDNKKYNGTGEISLGKIVSPGKHTLSFRLDPIDNEPSTVLIGEDIDFFLFEDVEKTFPWSMFLPAIIGGAK